LPRARKPSFYHAYLVVDAAKTTTVFLISEFVFRLNVEGVLAQEDENNDSNYERDYGKNKLDRHLHYVLS